MLLNNGQVNTGGSMAGKNSVRHNLGSRVSMTEFLSKLYPKKTSPEKKQQTALPEKKFDKPEDLFD